MREVRTSQAWSYRSTSSFRAPLPPHEEMVIEDLTPEEARTFSKRSSETDARCRVERN